MSRLLLVPLDDVVVFPGMSVTLAVDAGEDDRVLLVPHHENEYAGVGTVAEVSNRVRLPGGDQQYHARGVHRRDGCLLAARARPVGLFDAVGAAAHILPQSPVPLEQAGARRSHRAWLL